MSPRAIFSVPAINSAASVSQDFVEQLDVAGSGTNFFTSAPRDLIWSREGSGYWLAWDLTTVKYSSSLRGPWTNWSLPAAITNTSGRFQYVNGMYLCGEGTNSSSVPLYFASTIGGAWSTRTSGVNGGHRKYIWHPSSQNWFMVGPSNFLTYSPTPMTPTSWTSLSRSGVWRCCATNGTDIVICENSGIMQRSTSPTGTWSSVTSSFGTTGINDIIYDGPDGAKVWVAVGDSGKAGYTTVQDGSSGWTQISGLGSGTTTLNRIQYHRGRWIITSSPADSAIARISSGSNIATSTWTGIQFQGNSSHPVGVFPASNGLMFAACCVVSGSTTYGVVGAR